MMDHSQEHIATLCAAGTIGIAAAGLALGTTDGDLYTLQPGKRKAPGSNVVTSSPEAPPGLFHGRPPTGQSTQAAPSVASSSRAERRLSSTLLGRKTTRAFTPTGTEPNHVESRESSLSRRGTLRLWPAADRDSSTERKEQRPGSSWLKRISSISRANHTSPASSSSLKLVDSPTASQPSLADAEPPNKLVKRSSSRRLQDLDRALPALLRRPATSHQRSATLSSVMDSRPLTTGSALPESRACPAHAVIWRPFFDSGYSRKRFVSAGYREPGARTISAPHGCSPTLLMGGSVEPRDAPDVDEPRQTRPLEPGPAPSPALAPEPHPVARRHKIRRTLGSMRKGVPPRHFTDPIVRINKDEAYGSIVHSHAFSSISPMSNVSAFEVELPAGSPIFTSSPPSYGPSQHRFTVPKRMSVARSDPTTVSSDNEPRVFSDDDSMDFRSDTAYDSLATRATASSHSAFRPPNIETIFDEAGTRQPPSPPKPADIEVMMQRTTLDDMGPPVGMDLDANHVGIGITGIETTPDRGRDTLPRASTPTQELGPESQSHEVVTTPVPKKVTAHHDSSPLSMLSFARPGRPEPELPQMMDLDVNDDIDWSPKVVDDANGVSTVSPDANRMQIRFACEMPEDDVDENRSAKRSSIFDWSEHQKVGSEQSNGVGPRPKTVHGKQGSNLNRSRASGRKSNATIHLRSQSVPVNRDSLSEADLPSSATKFGTWALGTKPVSEEWSDDFEFDEPDVEPAVVAMVRDEKAVNRESIRSVKVPQSIIDRQQSVHIQFGQVREFMLLVEELKRLRVRGMDLSLLHGPSRQLWEDASSIIDLATVNDDEETGGRPPSPLSSDFFGDETPPPKRAAEEEAGRPMNRRSISSPDTPPHGRSRGESIQTRTFLQSIHQNRTGVDSSPAPRPTREKLPFDTQDLRDLVVRAGVITRALKDIVRKAEGVSLSPEKTPKFQDSALRQMFDPPESSPNLGLRKPGLPKSRSANSYLDPAGGKNDHDLPPPPTLNFTTVVEAN